MGQPDVDRNSGKAALGQGEEAALLNKEGKSYQNWWPGMSRWHLGMICEDSTVELGTPEVFQ